MLIVDAHTHIFPPEVARHRESYCQTDRFFGELYANPSAKIATAEDLIEEMDAAGVDISVICGFGWADHDLCVTHNDYLLDSIARYPDRLVALVATQPLAGDRALGEIERCLAKGAKGVGELMPDGQGYQLSDIQRIEVLFQFASEHRFPIMTHASEPVGHSYPGKESVTPGAIWPLVQAFPDVKLILAHWGGGYPFYELMPEVRRLSRNVYYDSAASSYLYAHQIFRHVGDIVGFEKVLWATDFPVLRQTRFLQRMEQLSLPRDQHAAVIGGNATRLFGLRPDSEE
ncbi:MAG: amidohydrolase family protein [Chloroflexota bacterium]|jgi:predicted TIM-barrel fold metal-dependent hydrolase